MTVHFSFAVSRITQILLGGCAQKIGNMGPSKVDPNKF